VKTIVIDRQHALARTQQEWHLRLRAFLPDNNTPCEIQRKDPIKGSRLLSGINIPNAQR